MRRHEARSTPRTLALLTATAWLVLNGVASAQGLTGALIGRVQDEHGVALAGPRVTTAHPP